MNQCDSCGYYVYDEESQDYWCTVNLDEDEMGRLLADGRQECPYYRMYDEYQIVRKQL